MKGMEPFIEAMDVLVAQGVNPMAAAHMHDYELLRVESFDRKLLKGWRRWFYHERKTLEMGRNESL